MTSPAPSSGQPDPAALLALGLATQSTETSGSPTPPLSPDQLAAEFPQLEIIELLGRGGMGAVYKARQRDLDRLVALKILRPGLDADPGFAERFTREARALAQLNHPGIVTLYEFGKTSAGRYFILMEFVDGVNLRQLLDAGRLSPREALAIVPPLCDALQYAHDRGLVHRDIKPENLLIDRLGRIKIADFGIARLASDGRDGSSDRPAENITFTATVGTPPYMAPEQRTRPAAVDHRADLYALGVVLYQMLTGELPAAGQLQPPSTRVHLDVRLDEIVLRALEKDPARRYAAATEFKTQIETVAAATASASPSPSSGAPAETSHTRRVFSPWLGCLVLCAAYLCCLVFSAEHLPERVASHFNFLGEPDGWMSRTDYLAFIAMLPCALVAFFALVGCTLRWLPARTINIPHRDHWLAPERKADTAALFFRWMAVPACLLLVLFAQVHLAQVLANQTSPARFPSGLLMGPVIGFLVALMTWIIGLVLRFSEPYASPAKLRRQSRALLVVGLLALVTPSAPLLTRITGQVTPDAAPVPRASNPPSKPTYRFGTTREITLPRRRPVAYDFDEGRFVDYVPSPRSPHGIDASTLWHAENGTDVFADPKSYRPGALFLGTDLAEIPPKAWNASADEVARYAGKAGRGLKTFIPAPPHDDPPATLLYRTPQNTRVLIQLLLATDAGDITLRYKTLHDASDSPGSAEKQANLSDADHTQVRANIIGAVSRTGSYLLPPQPTLLDAVAAAGGWTSIADQSAVVVTIGNRSEVHDLERILHGEAVNPPVENESTIWIPNRNR